MDTLSVFNDAFRILLPHTVFGISLVTVLGLLFMLEQWLASTTLVKSNSTLQLILSWIDWIRAKVNLLTAKDPPPPSTPTK